MNALDRLVSNVKLQARHPPRSATQGVRPMTDFERLKAERDAAYAAADAAYAAYAAAAARIRVLSDCADIVRNHYPKPPKITVARESAA